MDTPSEQQRRIGGKAPLSVLAEPHQQHCYIAGADPGDAARLPDGQGTDVTQLLLRLDAQSRNFHIVHIRRQQPRLLTGELLHLLLLAGNVAGVFELLSLIHIFRAALMQALLLCAPLMRREYDAPTALAAALLMLLVQDPWCIASAGLQLSFCAVAGLVLFYSKTQRAMLASKAFQWMAKKPMGKAVRCV